MAEPLVTSFAADTSRAQSAMQNLAAQVIGNMTSIGVAQPITAALQQYDRGLDRSLSKRVGRSQARYGSSR